MAKRKVIVSVKDYEILQKNLDQMRKAPATVLGRTISDMKERAPGWIASEVVKVYGVKKEELRPGDKPIGKIKVKGTSVNDVEIEYKGRVLTPTHFGMTPTTPKPAYTLKAGIFKGKKSQLGKVKRLTKKQRQNIGKNFRREGTQTSDHSPIMLMHTGNTKEGGVDYIPFQRKSTDRNDIVPIKTVSLPQMVDNKEVRTNIGRVINENLGKRIEHHMKLLEK